MSKETHLNSITNVPAKFATLVLSHATAMSSTALAVVRLNSTSVSRNFQNAATVGTKPTRPYTIPPNSMGGTMRKGKMSNRTLVKRKSISVLVSSETQMQTHL